MLPYNEFTHELRLFTFDTPVDRDMYFDHFSGRTADGRQVLAGLDCGSTWSSASGIASWQVIWFDSMGMFDSTEVVTIQLDPTPLPPNSPEALRERRSLRNHMESIGVTAGSIKVRHFWLDDPFRMGITLLPPWSPEQFWDPYTTIPGSQNLQEALDAIKGMARSVGFGDFQLWWGEENIGVRGDQYPYDHPERNQPVGPPLHLRPGHLYTIDSYGPDEPGPYYCTGRLSDGRQGLMGWYINHVVCLLFDQAGTLLETAERPSGYVREEDDGEEEVSQHAMALRVASTWQAELNWQPQSICVRAFMHPDRPIFISDVTRAGVTTLYDPFQYPDVQEREQMRQSLRQWFNSGRFVLNWMRDYHVTENGEVESS